MSSLRTRAHQALASERRVEILRTLEEAEDGLGVDAIARSVGLHVNTVREHLDRLVACGFVTRAPEHRTTRGRPRIVFRAAEHPEEVLSSSRARDHLTRLLVQGYGSPVDNVTSAAEEAGRAWSRARVQEDGIDATSRPHGTPPPTADEVLDHQMAVLDEHLVAHCFDPAPGPQADLQPGDRSLTLRSCPVIDLARDRPEVVCSVHLGVIRGVVDSHPGPARVRDLVPADEPGVCVLRLDLVSDPDPEPGDPQGA